MRTRCQTTSEGAGSLKPSRFRDRQVCLKLRHAEVRARGVEVFEVYTKVPGLFVVEPLELLRAHLELDRGPRGAWAAAAARPIAAPGRACSHEGSRAARRLPHRSRRETPPPARRRRRHWCVGPTWGTSLPSRGGNLGPGRGWARESRAKGSTPTCTGVYFAPSLAHCRQ